MKDEGNVTRFRGRFYVGYTFGDCSAVGFSDGLLRGPIGDYLKERKILQHSFRTPVFA